MAMIEADATHTARRPWLDMARGIAVVAMVVYHSAWDLNYFGLITQDVAYGPGWRWFARLIAGSFLMIAGYSLVLATRSGIDWRRSLIRLALLVGAAALVTIVTFIAFPESYIFFGILHCIATCTLLGFALRRAPDFLLLLLAAAMLVLPFYWRSDFFDSPALVWTGLGLGEPRTNDFEPLFPWAGPFLLGLLAGRHLHFTGRAFHGIGAGALRWLGRHSLPVYLVHQPLLFAVAMGLSSLPFLQNRVGEANFIQSCTADCYYNGTEKVACQRTCACVVDHLKNDPVWTKVLANTLDEDETTRLMAAGKACFAASTPSNP